MKEGNAFVLARTGVVVSNFGFYDGQTRFGGLNT